MVVKAKVHSINQLNFMFKINNKKRNNAKISETGTDFLLFLFI
jgi:hypothetical protein